MKRFIAMFLILAFVGCGSAAFAADDSECDCNCKKGGLGLAVAGFICGFGFKSYNSKLGCNKAVGVGVVLGTETHGMLIGGGFNQGVLGLGFTFKGPVKTTAIGFSIGYDYSDCRMVWPIEE